MTMKLFRFVLLAAIVSIANHATFGQKQSKCGLGKLRFACSKEYSTIPNTASLFIAKYKDKEFNFNVFLAESESGSDETLAGRVLAVLFPKESSTYRWKYLTFSVDKPASQFETARRRLLGYNGKLLVTIDVRHFTKAAASFVTGTITPNDETGQDAEHAFNEGYNLSSGACFEALRITRLLTGEKDSEQYDPCTMRLTVIGRPN